MATQHDRDGHELGQSEAHSNGWRIIRRLQKSQEQPTNTDIEPIQTAGVHKKMFARLRNMEHRLTGSISFGDFLTYFSLDFLARLTQRELKTLLTNAQFMWTRQVNRHNFLPYFDSPKPVVDKVLASESGSYWLTFSLTERGKKAVHSTDQQRLFSDLILTHIRSLTVQRTKDKRRHNIPWNPNETHVAFASKEHYWIVVHVNNQACKIRITPDSQTSVHDQIWQQLNSKIWREFHPSRSDVELTHQTNLTRSTWQNRVEDSTNLFAADISLVIVQRADATSLEELQNDPRHFTALGIPHSWRVQVDTAGNILDIDLKAYHPTTDGATQLEEAQATIHLALKHCLEAHLSPQPLIPGLYPDNKTVITQHEYYCPVSEIKIEANPLRERTGGLFRKLKELQKKYESSESVATHNKHQLISKLLQIKFTPHLALQIAGMMTLNIEHSHFLEMESEHKRLNPAILALPLKLMREIQNVNSFDDRHLELLADCLIDFQNDREDAKHGLGMAAFYATLTTGPLRKPLQFFGHQIDRLKTDFLTDSTLFSMLVGSRSPVQTQVEQVLEQASRQKAGTHSPYLITSGFTTAFSEVYQNAFGMCDTNGGKEISVTLRSRDANTKHQNASLVNSHYASNLEKVLSYFERVVAQIEAEIIKTEQVVTTR